MKHGRSRRIAKFIKRRRTRRALTRMDEQMSEQSAHAIEKMEGELRRKQENPPRQ
jgi:hypothetical protein